MCIDMILYNLRKNMFYLWDGLGMLLSGDKNGQVVDELNEEQQNIAEQIKKNFKKGYKIG